MKAETVDAIELWPIDRLRPYPRNPRKNDSVVERMVESIREFGFKIPCLVRSSGEIVDGQTQPDMNLVAEAANGREAVQRFREHHPDITLMDLQMPAMNGLETMVAIRKEFPEAKIIILTTYESDVQGALKLGA